ncbi:MAG: hypothetical protein R3E01_07040 [Pirellulaceae bacterium]
MRPRSIERGKSSAVGFGIGTAAYENALGDEPHRCLDSGFRALLATEPSTEFTQLWAADMHRYQVRFPQPQESYT